MIDGRVWLIKHDGLTKDQMEEVREALKAGPRDTLPHGTSTEQGKSGKACSRSHGSGLTRRHIEASSRVALLTSASPL